jgi:hypothetical protein
VETWRTFPPEADQIWNAVVPHYPLVFDRSREYLNWRFVDPRYLRLGVSQGERLLGWVVCKTTPMRDNRYFGNMTVGTIVDLLVDPTRREEIQSVLSVGLRSLVESGADLIVMNLSEQRLVREVRRLGFAAGPSNFHFFTKNLPKLVLEECHLTRGDSDGDAHL